MGMNWCQLKIKNYQNKSNYGFHEQFTYTPPTKHKWGTDSLDNTYNKEKPYHKVEKPIKGRPSARGSHLVESEESRCTQPYPP